MARRNPQNERYRKDAQIGTTRRSASSAKPKRSAGSVDRSSSSSSRSSSSSKSRVPFEPDSPRFRRWRKWWLGLLIAAIVFSIGGWQLQDTPGGAASLVAAYTCLAMAIYVDITKIRRMRKEWREEQDELSANKKSKKKSSKSETAGDDVVDVETKNKKGDA